MADEDGNYITLASFRRTSGISESQISNTDVGGIITEIEKKVPRFFNTVFTPTERIDILDGDGTNRLLLDKNPILSVRELKIDGDTIDPANLEIKKDSGYIFLSNEADVGRFVEKKNKNVVKYIYGTVEYNEDTRTNTNADSTAGTSIALSVTSESGFATDNWIEIYGMDGFREVAQITGTSSGEITVDQLVLTHESGSTIDKIEIWETFKELMNIIASISGIARVIGESASDTVGYDIAEFHVQKGEPYTQWRETVKQQIKLRDEIYSKISIRPYIL